MLLKAIAAAAVADSMAAGHFILRVFTDASVARTQRPPLRTWQNLETRASGYAVVMK
jgi:hypothetical protein